MDRFFQIKVFVSPPKFFVITFFIILFIFCLSFLMVTHSQYIYYLDHLLIAQLFFWAMLWTIHKHTMGPVLVHSPLISTIPCYMHGLHVFPKKILTKLHQYVVFFSAKWGPLHINFITTTLYKSPIIFTNKSSNAMGCIY